MNTAGKHPVTTMPVDCQYELLSPRKFDATPTVALQAIPLSNHGSLFHLEDEVEPA